MFISLKNAKNLGLSMLGFRRSPSYVQFYVTSRCNLTCKQCNIIYANANVREVSIDEVEKIAENLSEIGLGIILLTGGEPFIRQDLPQIIHAFESRGIHVRTQTNGLATREQFLAAVQAGARDISISLDSLNPGKQDFLNGSYQESWMRAIESISLVTQTYPARHSFASLGTVLSPHSLLEIPNIIRFATRIGWYVSLVPAHITNPSRVYSFRSYDREMVFPPSIYALVDEVLKNCLQLKRHGFALYDSLEYINNVRKFIRQENITWRRRNKGLCDSPNLYFAIRPNGNLSVCCDHNLRESFPVMHSDFPRLYRENYFHKEIDAIKNQCAGCMYGSFPEISITAHYLSGFLDRLKVFTQTPLKKPWPISKSKLLEIAKEINEQYPVDQDLATELLEKVKRHADVTCSV